MSKAPTLERDTTEAEVLLVEASTQQKGRTLRRPITKMIVMSVVLSIIGGALVGYLVYRASDDPLARGQAADSARWQAQADAYLNADEAKAAIERGHAADTERWQAQAEAYLAAQKAKHERLNRSQAADTARWQGQADAWLTGHDGANKTADR